MNTKSTSSHWRSLLEIVFIGLGCCAVFLSALSHMPAEPTFIRLLLKISLGCCAGTTLLALVGGPVLIWVDTKTKTSNSD